MHSHIAVAAPFVRTTRKARYSDADVQRAIDAVLEAAVYVDRLLPVVFADRVIAWVSGERFPSRRVHWIEHKPWLDRSIDDRGFLFGWATIDQLINDTTQNGNMRTSFYFKSFNASPPGVSWEHLFMMRGNPPEGVLDGVALTAKQHSNTDQGAIPIGSAVSPDTRHLLSLGMRQSGDATTSVVYCLYDFVLGYEQCSPSAVSQTFINGAAAARYISAGEPGLCIMACTNTVDPGSTTYNVMTYTDQDGNAGQTVPSSTSFITASQATLTSGIGSQTQIIASDGSNLRGVLMMPLQPGDTGVRQLDDFTMSGAGSGGTLAFLLSFPIAYLPARIGDVSFLCDFVKRAPALPRIYDTACLTFAAYNGNSLFDNHSGMLQYGWG